MLKTTLLTSVLFLTLAGQAVADRYTPQENFDALCETSAVMTDKLSALCGQDVSHLLIKSGERFKNVGIGVELNTLIRNIGMWL